MIGIHSTIEDGRLVRLRTKAQLELKVCEAFAYIRHRTQLVDEETQFGRGAAF